MNKSVEGFIEAIGVACFFGLVKRFIRPFYQSVHGSVIRQELGSTDGNRDIHSVIVVGGKTVVLNAAVKAFKIGRQILFV